MFKLTLRKATPFSKPARTPEKGVFILEVVRIFLEVIGALTILKYVLLEGKEVISAGGKFICSVKKTANRIRNSK